MGHGWLPVNQAHGEPNTNIWVKNGEFGTASAIDYDRNFNQPLHKGIFKLRVRNND